ncbi:Camphene synthase [Pseudomonas sp. S5D5]|uniref:terpene synthase family protein n=1 Tax=Pseudomonas sp. S5D5 TaxID=2083056 RepID=UPI000D0F1FA5|nr:Camphene synthase [Pseudomonas sp. S5D5]
MPDSPLIVPKLHCPEPTRVDEQLARQVDDLLLPWIDRMGIFTGQTAKVHATGFGRFAMLCHPDTDAPERLLLVAQAFAALISLDDQYCYDELSGTVPQPLGPRLLLALAAVEPVRLTAPYSATLAHALASDAVTRALQDCMVHLVSLASPSQAARVRYELAVLFVAMNAEATWRTAQVPTLTWEYLVQRQGNSFMPFTALIDVVAGYELNANIYASAPVRQIITLVSCAATLVNDLYSTAREQVTGEAFNLPTLLADEHHCSLQDAMCMAAMIHDDLVRTYEAQEYKLLKDASPALKRFLRGLKAWMAGSREWHQRSGRYQV